MIGLNIELGDARKVSYTVEHRGACVLIFGSVPFSAYGALVKLVPKKSVMDTHLARIAGCSIAMGLCEDTKKLIAEMTPAAIEKARVNYNGTGLSAQATRWLAVGERGSSSDAMFLALTGIKPAGMKDPLSFPHDPDDFRRCRLLLDQVPELATKLGNLSGISPIWARIAAAWETLCKTMDTESPDWRDSNGKATKTYELLKGLEDGPLVSASSANKMKP